MKTPVKFLIGLLVLGITDLHAQYEAKLQKYNTLTFIYVDNSSLDTYEELNDEMADNLTNLVKGQPDNSNFIYFIACNDEKHIKEETDEKLLIGSNGFLIKYLSHASRYADFFADKEIMRDHFVNYPVKVTQRLSMYFYLSSASVNRLFQDVEAMPTPLLFPTEFLQYLELNSDTQLNLKVYVNKEITSKYTEDQIRNLFTFCNNHLNNFKFELSVSSL